MKFLLALILLTLSTASDANINADIYKGEASQAAEAIRQEIRTSKVPSKLQELIIIDLLRGDQSAFINDYLEFSKILYATHTEKISKVLIPKKSNYQSEVTEVDENSYRHWDDFTRFVVNYYSILYSRHDNSWVPEVGSGAPARSANKVGAPDPLWTTLNLFMEAQIYYLEKKFFLAEVQSHNALSHLFLLDPQTPGGQLALSIATNYFESISANRRVSEMLSKVIIDNQNTPQAIKFNPYSGKNIITFIQNVSPDNALEIIKNPEIVNTSYSHIDMVKSNWIDKSETLLVTKAIQIYLEEDESKAKEYLDKNYRSGSSFIFNDLISGVIYKNKDIPSKRTEQIFESYISELEKNKSSIYDVGYTKLYRSILKVIGFKNKGNKAQANEEIYSAINHLETVANVYQHPPGTTLPSVFRGNRVLLDLFMRYLIDSEIDVEYKSRAIETISSLSLVSSEYEYVNALDLIDNIKSEYGKNIAVEYQSFITKRDKLYKDLFQNYLASEIGGFKPNIDGYLALQSINLRLNHTLKNFYATGLVEKERVVKKVKLSPSELFVNIFCLESFCYSYLRFNNEIYLKHQLRDKVELQAQSFINAIKEGGDGRSEGKAFANFMFSRSLDFNEIEKCHLVPTSGFSALPLHLVSVNNSYLIDMCQITTYTSLQHFERANENKNHPKRSKWALSIADPLIRSKSESKAVEETLSMIRGVQSLEDIAELPETADEAMAIVGDNKKLSTLLLREDAKKDLLFLENLSNYQVLSFSTHGLMAGETSSNLSPAILLSPSDKGALLTTDEILELPGASSVVILAVCNASSLPANLSFGEISSIANAFLMKGSSSVVSTLWQLESKASVKILETTFKYIKSGLSVSQAAQQASILYRQSNPKSSPREWGAFIVYGDTPELDDNPIQPTYGNGNPIDLTLFEDKIYVLAKQGPNFGVDIWDKNNLKFIKRIDLLDINDAKFLARNSTDIITLKNNVLSVNALNTSNSTSLEICSAQVGAFWRVNSTLIHEGKVYSSLGGRTDSYTGISYIDLNNCRYSNLFFDLKNEDKLFDRSAVGLINNIPTAFANHKLPEGMRSEWVNKYTSTGLKESCINTWEATWQQLAINPEGVMSFSFSDVPGEVGGSNVGYVLPQFSHNLAPFIITNDSCSDRSALVDYQNLYKPEKIFNFIDKTGPWAIGDYFNSGKLSIRAESYFNSFGKGGYWKKLLNSNSEANLFVTAKVGNGSISYLGPISECSSFVGAEVNGVGYIACNQKNGYSLQTIR